MKRTNSVRRPAAVLLVAIAFAARLGAHDFWMEPSTFEPAVGSGVRVALRVGENFTGDPVARRADLIESFFVVGPDGRQDVAGRDGMEPAGLLRLTSPGTFIVGYRSRPSSVKLQAPEFEKYLKQEGLERIIEARAKSGQSTAPGVEVFSRSAKTMLTAGNGELSGHDRVTGMTLELIPERHPSALSADGTMPIRLLYQGRPLEGALVVGVPQDTRTPRQARSDQDGRVTLSLYDGVWLIKAVHMVPAPAGSGADWESLWASVTFKATKRRAATGRGLR